MVGKHLKVKKIITDYGDTWDGTCKDPITGELKPEYDVPRYLVWKVEKDRKATHVIDSNDNLDHLLAKHGKLQVIRVY